ncbi:7380_t:CDS:2, partial [Entrophospora sp. SA101]
MDIVGICIPSIELVVKIAYELHNAVENARYNKKMCIDLGDRVEAGSRALYDLYRHREERVEVFKDERFYVNLQRYLNATEEVKEFVVEITQSSGAMKYLKSISYKEKLSQIVGRYDQAIHDLSLEINTRNFKNIEILQVEIEKGFNNINSYLGTIQESLKDKQDDLKLIFEQLTALNKGKGNSPEYLVHEISLANLTDPKPDDNLDNLVHGKVFKKHLNKVIPVACVPYDEENLDKDYLKKQFRILSKLFSSNNIIKFHGLSVVDGKKVMIFDWAKYGNLKSVYENYSLNWVQKLKIVHDICTGLCFLHECAIFHHDVRCENILIMENFETAKISNFSLSREHADISRRLSLTELIPWMAPEKLGNPTRQNYTTKCEVHSFGMLIWELSFQEVPYKKKFGNDLVKITEHVINGKREDLTRFDNSNEIQRKFKCIIYKAWLHASVQRSNLSDILNNLAKLYKKYCIPKAKPIRKNEQSNRPHANRITNGNDTNYDDIDADNILILQLENVPESTLTLKEGIKYHKEGEQEKRKVAWKCFEYHAD